MPIVVSLPLTDLLLLLATLAAIGGMLGFGLAVKLTRSKRFEDRNHRHH